MRKEEKESREKNYLDKFLLFAINVETAVRCTLTKLPVQKREKVCLQKNDISNGYFKQSCVSTALPVSEDCRRHVVCQTSFTPHFWCLMSNT